MAALRDPFILEHRLRYQFQQLIIEPIQKMDMPLFPSMIIVVDAIDTCDDEENLVAELITLIAGAQKNSLLPLRFFITSRPEPSIKVEFSELNVHTIYLQDFDAEDDIRLFLRHRFREIRRKREAVIKNARWPLDADIKTLVHRASGSFIFAATVVQFMGDKHGNPLQRLKRIVRVEPRGSPSPYADLDRLYTQILDTAPDIDILRKILGVVVVFFRPPATWRTGEHSFIQLGER